MICYCATIKSSKHVSSVWLDPQFVGTIQVAAAPVKKTRVSLVFCNGKKSCTGCTAEEKNGQNEAITAREEITSKILRFHEIFISR